MKHLLLVLLPMFAFADIHFGYRGKDGEPGYSGRAGAEGYSQTVRADGGNLNIDAAGGEGEDGRDGRRGEEASYCNHNWPNDNTRGATGGDGGKGGNSGEGGHGGNVVIYYSDLSAVKKVYVRASGGRAGRAGYGGEAGNGCFCANPRSWIRKICRTEKDKDGKSKEVCQNKTFYCYQGDQGRRGLSGYQSNHGNPGYLALIKSDDLLEPDHDYRAIDFGEVVKKSPFELSKNVFRIQSGARSLVAPGSVVQDNFFQFVKRRSATVAVQWKSRRDSSVFAGRDMRFSLTEDSLNIASVADIWMHADVENQAGGYLVSVSKILFGNEVGKLQMDGITGSKRSLKIYVRDTAMVSDQLNTVIWLKFESDGFFNHTRFEGIVPADLVEIKEDVLEINVGKLGIDEKYLASGENIKITVEATRSLDAHSLKQKLKSDFKIP